MTDEYISFIRELINNPDLDKSEIYEKIFGETVAYDTARKQLRGIQNFLDLLEDKQDEDQIQILKKERIKISTETLQLNQLLREQARQELIEEKIVEAIKNIKIDIPKHKIDIPQNENLAFNLLISDEHVGNEFVVKDLLGNVINKYNNSIFEERMWKIFDKALKYQKDFKKIKVLDLGDSIEGILRLSSLRGLKHGAIDSAAYYGEFLLYWLTELSKVFYVEIGEADGNHSETRPLGSKKNDFPKENLATMVRTILKVGINYSKNPNLVLLPCTEKGNVYTKSAGFDLLAIHGQDEKTKLDEIYRDYNSFYNNNIDYILVGHLHYNAESENKNVIRIPSIVGTNMFSENIKKRSNAGAEILIFESKIGLVEQHHIILQK